MCKFCIILTLFSNVICQGLFGARVKFKLSRENLVVTFVYITEVGKQWRQGVIPADKIHIGLEHMERLQKKNMLNHQGEIVTKTGNAGS